MNEKVTTVSEVLRLCMENGCRVFEPKEKNVPHSEHGWIITPNKNLLFVGLVTGGLQFTLVLPPTREYGYGCRCKLQRKSVATRIFDFSQIEELEQSGISFAEKFHILMYTEDEVNNYFKTYWDKDNVKELHAKDRDNEATASLHGATATGLSGRPLRRLTQEELNETLKKFRGFQYFIKRSSTDEETAKETACVDLSYTDLSDLDLTYKMLVNINFEGACLKRANLIGADIRVSNFTNAGLRGADLSGAYIDRTDFTNAGLRGADLSGAYIDRTDFTNAGLRGADLSGIYIDRTDFTNAGLRGADLSGARIDRTDFTNADLRGANCYYAIVSKDTNIANAIIDDTTKYLNDQCPETGSFIGYKKARGLSGSNYNQEYVIELEILEEAKRSSATTEKCRCSKAKVLSITNLDGTPAKVKKARSYQDSKFIYTVGEIVEVPDFNEDWRAECTTGIHFFMNEEDAINYHFGYATNYHFG